MSKPAPEKLAIRPSSAGLRVRKLDGQLLKSEGELVVWNAYWRRRELEGDIERIAIDAKPTPESGPSAADPLAGLSRAKADAKPTATPKSKAE